MPPPIVMPSAKTTIGFGYSAMRALRAYSARKKPPASSRSPADDLRRKPAHVAARAEAALARAVEQDELDVGVVAPRVQRRGEVADHAEIERVDRPGRLGSACPGRRSPCTHPARGACGRVCHVGNVTPRRTRRRLRADRTAPAERARHGDRRFSAKIGGTAPRGGEVRHARRTSAGVLRRHQALRSGDRRRRTSPPASSRASSPASSVRTAPARPRPCASSSASCARPSGTRPRSAGVPYAKLPHPLQTVGAALEASSFHPGRTAANHLKVYAQAAGLPDVARRRGARPRRPLAMSAGARSAATRSACASGWDSPTPCSATPGCWCSTSPRTASTPRASSGCAGCCASSRARAARCFVSSHLLAEVQQTVDALLIISQGRLVFQGGARRPRRPDRARRPRRLPDRAASRRPSAAPASSTMCCGRASRCAAATRRDRRARARRGDRAVVPAAPRPRAGGGLPRPRQRRAGAPERRGGGAGRGRTARAGRTAGGRRRTWLPMEREASAATRGGGSRPSARARRAGYGRRRRAGRGRSPTGAARGRSTSPDSTRRERADPNRNPSRRRTVDRGRAAERSRPCRNRDEPKTRVRRRGPGPVLRSSTSSSEDRRGGASTESADEAGADRRGR